MRPRIILCMFSSIPYIAFAGQLGYDGSKHFGNFNKTVEKDGLFMVLKPFYEDPSALHIGTEPIRSYFIPCASEEEAGGCRTGSSRLQMLSGEWDFCYYESPHALPEDFFKPEK